MVSRALLGTLIILSQSFALACTSEQEVIPNLHGVWDTEDICSSHGASYKTNRDRCQPEVTMDVPPLEMVPLIVSGSSDNRVDLVFFGDGYLQSEREKFIADAKRLAEDVSRNQTFYTVQPLMNFWAAFSPSKESGIGVGGKPKDTVYGLYRDGTQLRGVYYKYPEVARAACASLGSSCDYPILLGNDPYYGGLGGEFTVITASYLNGPLVLRHELGHSIIRVGEEYDGGFAYSGVNAITNLNNDISWRHWLTDPRPGKPRVERSVMPYQSYVWALLNTTTPWSTRFTSSGTYTRYLVMLSLSSIPESSYLSIELDGVDLGWEAEPLAGMDRWHYEIYGETPLSSGVHEIKFTLKESSVEGYAQLGSLEVLEFGDESEFISRPGYYGLFPTFSDHNETSYRPTNTDCLMRRVTNPNFCKVCMEGLWTYLLRDLQIIEKVTETCQRKGNSSVLVLYLTLLPLAHLRTTPIPKKESYTITWSRNDQILSSFTNKTRIEVENTQAIAKYTVNVTFTTEEVRIQSATLRGFKEYYIFSQC